ncbi:hypothetical protein [Streptomyces mobaraensis]|uniref:Uncharacterized protein n=1 Tax=Streptomyces mobaraensis TaxID=35621 RepID=A0A5N5W3W9_STRMB|nr:hypothetical protein [Streptomyces mobaraensis]KAB7839464.1 hypothetical protein FRZ00_21200 [Streptomyces mobaraensis]
MSAANDTSTQNEDAQAKQEKNTTRESILVCWGRTWEGLDTRQSKSRDGIESVADGQAQVRDRYSTKHSTLNISRVHRHSTGFRLVEPGELKYGVRTVASHETAQP